MQEGKEKERMSTNLYNGYKYSSYEEYYNACKQKTIESHKENREKYNEYQRNYQKEYQRKAREQNKAFKQIMNHPLFPIVQQMLNHPELYQHFIAFINLINNNPSLYQRFLNSVVIAQKSD